LRAPARARRSAPDEDCILVLQGGGALGAYQAGVYECLAAMRQAPEWIAGISIGAINAALIAGNPAERRVERLRTFWETVSSFPFAAPAYRGPGANDLGGRLPDGVANTWRKGREGQARQHVIGLVEAAVGKDFLDLGRRTGDRDQARVVDRFPKELGEVGVGVDGQQGRVLAEQLEDRPGEGADAGPVFDE